MARSPGGFIGRKYLASTINKNSALAAGHFLVVSQFEEFATLTARTRTALLAMAFFNRQTTITKAQFEECLETYFEKIQAGTFARVKQEIGGVWSVIIDDMYRQNAERINPKNLVEIIGDCAEIIVGTVKELKTKGS